MERMDPQDMIAIENMLKAHTAPIMQSNAVVEEKMAAQEVRWKDHKEEHTDLKSFLRDVNAKTNTATDGVKKLWYGMGGAMVVISAVWALITFVAR